MKQNLKETRKKNCRIQARIKTPELFDLWGVSLEKSNKTENQQTDKKKKT